MSSSTDPIPQPNPSQNIPLPSSTTTQSKESIAKSANRLRNAANNKKYGTPLPILLVSSQLHPSRLNPPLQSSSSSSSTSPPSVRQQERSDPSSASRHKADSQVANSSLLSLLGNGKGVQSVTEKTTLIPSCKGVYDAATRSVWVTDREDMDLIFSRGFFGKGTLSRSEPSWRERRIGLLRGGDTLAAEQMREARRKARKEFKLLRAQAILDAAKAAEAVLTSVPTPSSSYSSAPTSSDALDSTTGDDDSSIPISGGGTGDTRPPVGILPDGTKLTPQTFLVRPERPDANRNRGKNAWKSRPRPAASAQETPIDSSQLTSSTNLLTSTSTVPSSTSTTSDTTLQSVTQQAITTLATPNVDVPVELLAENLDDEDDDEGGEFDESLIEEMEHLQLSLEEAWFLSGGIGVLKIFDPITETYAPPGPALISLFLTPPPLPKSISTSQKLLPDDPFLVSYVAYHHYRSLGWVVKPGIKFCSDWLLYKRGPVFSHSTFSCVLIPIYSDANDRANSPHSETDWYQQRTTWKWMNTIMRVNSLVQKVVILVYITIPPLSSFPASKKLEDESLNIQRNDMRSLLERYTIREVVLTRFGPARRRD